VSDHELQALIIVACHEGSLYVSVGIKRVKNNEFSLIAYYQAEIIFLN